MVLYKIGKDEGFNPLFPLLLCFKSKRYMFLVSERDSFTAALTVIFSATLLALAVVCFVMPPLWLGKLWLGKLSPAIPLSLVMVLWLILRSWLFPRKCQLIETDDLKQVGIGKSVFLAEWIVVCFTVMIFFMLAARDTGFEILYNLGMVFVLFIFTPMVDISLYQLRTNRMR